MMPGKNPASATPRKKRATIEFHRRPYESRERRDKAPRNENSREPFPRAPPLDKQRAGNFEEEIANEKNAETETENIIFKSQVVLHAQLRESDIRSVEIRHDVEEKNERKHPPRDLSPQRGWIDTQVGWC